MAQLIERLSSRAAIRLVAWAAKHVDQDQVVWLDALRAEMATIEGGRGQLWWAMGALGLVRIKGTRRLTQMLRRRGVLVLTGLEAALVTAVGWNIERQYAALAVVLFAMTAVALVVALLLFWLVRAAVSELSGQFGRLARAFDLLGSRSNPVLGGAVCLAALLVLVLTTPAALNQVVGKQGVATAGVVVSSADEEKAATVLRGTGALTDSQTYLTTQVQPIAVDGRPLAQLLQPLKIGPAARPLTPGQQEHRLKALIAKFTGIQGYDLAHGQFPDGAGMGFSPDWGYGYSGCTTMPECPGGAPPGRSLGASDSGTTNIWIPRDFPGVYYLTDNGATITVRSPATGQSLDLHVVGEYEPDGSATTPLFGMILADNNVVQKLTGGHPSHAYALHLGPDEIPTVFRSLRAAAPSAELYNFLTDRNVPSYALFTSPADPAGSYLDSNIQPPPLLPGVAMVWAGLLSLIIAQTQRIYATSRAITA